MPTLTTKVSEDTNNRLETLAKAIDRNKSYILKKAIENFLNEKESYLIALHSLEENETKISLEELKKKSMNRKLDVIT